MISAFNCAPSYIATAASAVLHGVICKRGGHCWLVLLTTAVTIMAIECVVKDKSQTALQTSQRATQDATQHARPDTAGAMTFGRFAEHKRA